MNRPSVVSPDKLRAWSANDSTAPAATLGLSSQAFCQSFSVQRGLFRSRTGATCSTPTFPSNVKRVSFRTVGFALLKTSSLGIHIAQVVGVRAEKQVTRVYAGAIVARMTDVLAVRDCTVMQFPRDSMSAQESAAAPLAQYAIPVFRQRSLPSPTFIVTAIGGSHALPKRLDQRRDRLSWLSDRNVFAAFSRSASLVCFGGCHATNVLPRHLESNKGD